MAIGFLTLAWNGYDEFQGSTSVPATYSGRYSFASSDSSQGIVIKKVDPEAFRNAMIYHWVRSSMLAIGGIILFRIDKSQERLDPLSPDFGGNKALDELEDEMNKEEEQHRHPEP